MGQDVRVTTANWLIQMKDNWITLKLDGQLMLSTDNLEDILTFIRKWHAPVSLEN